METISYVMFERRKYLYLQLYLFTRSAYSHALLYIIATRRDYLWSLSSSLDRWSQRNQLYHLVGSLFFMNGICLSNTCEQKVRLAGAEEGVTRLLELQRLGARSSCLYETDSIKNTSLNADLSSMKLEVMLMGRQVNALKRSLKVVDMNHRSVIQATISGSFSPS